MEKKLVAIFISGLFFILSFLVLLDQQLSCGIWFQIDDVHHETFALSSFSLAVGILLGLCMCTNEK